MSDKKLIAGLLKVRSRINTEAFRGDSSEEFQTLAREEIGYLEQAITSIEQSATEIKGLKDDNEVLKGFVRECAAITFEGGEFDGYEMQQSLIQRGILTEELRVVPCSENCNCADYVTSGTECACTTYAEFMKPQPTNNQSTLHAEGGKEL
jgi:hypothetical protein